MFLFHNRGLLIDFIEQIRDIRRYIVVTTLAWLPKEIFEILNMLLAQRMNNVMPNPLAPRASIYSDDISHTYHGNSVPAAGNAGDIPHAVDTPEIIEAVVTFGGDTMDNAAAVVGDFNIYGYIIIFITIILIISFLLDR